MARLAVRPGPRVSAITVVSVDSSSHSFANGDDPNRLAMFCVDVLEKCDRS